MIDNVLLAEASPCLCMRIDKLKEKVVEKEIKKRKDEGGGKERRREKEKKRRG